MLSVSETFETTTVHQWRRCDGDIINDDDATRGIPIADPSLLVAGFKVHLCLRKCLILAFEHTSILHIFAE